MANEVVEHGKSYGLQELEKMAEYTEKSGLFGMNKAQAMTLFLLSQAEGIHPMRAVQVYHIIQGRPSKKADAILAEFQNRGGKVTWMEYTDKKVTGIFEAPGIGKPLEVTWTIEQAKNVKNKGVSITEKDVWKSYPRQMLKARVISEGVRATMPDVVVGVYASEEVMDFDPINVTPPRQAPSAPIREPPTPERQSSIQDAVIVDDKPTKECPPIAEAITDIKALLQSDDSGLMMAIQEIIRSHVDDPKRWDIATDAVIKKIWIECQDMLNQQGNGQ